jgi:hypothetical protein
VEQIVVNLVVNALEALPAPAHGVTVTTRVEPVERCIVLAVEDEGVGIPPEHLAHLCDPFFTTKHESGGTGLGLAITSTLVRAHGGRLTFASEPGRGTRALVMLLCLSEPPPSQPLALYRLLQTYAFPGNVRELEALAFDAVARHQGGLLSLQSFKTAIGAAAPMAEDGTEPPPLSLSSLFPDRLPTL